jgi:ADP-ribose pyrophosphatase YjhB (NUDIX family)
VSYIQDLRKVVGNIPLIMVGATLLLLNKQNQLLMMRRTDNQCWGVPGGAMEIGEDLETTVRRETREEIGVCVGDLELFRAYSGEELYYQYPDGAEVYNVSIAYISRDFNELIILDPEEHSAFRWFELKNLPSEISPPIKPILRDLVRKYGIPTHF